MKKWFKRPVRRGAAAGLFGVFRLLSGWLGKWEERLAWQLNRRTRGYSPLTWKLILAAFCLGYGVYLLVLVWRIFY